jgi:hypothetical protein
VCHTAAVFDSSALSVVHDSTAEQLQQQQQRADAHLKGRLELSYKPFCVVLMRWGFLLVVFS